MLSFILRRLLQMIPVLWGVGTLVFVLLHLVPGDPVEIMLGENALPASKQSLRSSLGLDRPLLEQYINFWVGLAKGDLGKSLLSKKPVASLVLERIPATLSLALFTLVWVVAFSIPLGVFAAILRKSIFDRIVLVFSILGVSLPNFWIGPLLVLFLSVHLGWFPVSERSGFSSYILPSLTLGIGLCAVLCRMARATLAEALTQDFMVTARSKGLGPFSLYFKHALKNALIPIITVLGLQMGGLLAGTLITETIFDWPGLGELVYRAIQSRDFPLVQGCVLVIAFIYVFVNLLADIAYSFANPRLEVR